MTAYGTGRTTNDEAKLPAGISRRSVLPGAAAGAIALGADALAPTAEAATFVEGADISRMPRMEANGTFFWEPEGCSPFTGSVGTV